MDHSQSNKRFNEASLTQKIRWEGGLLASLAYGIPADAIDDASLAAQWRDLEAAYRAFAPLLEDVAERLGVAA